MSSSGPSGRGVIKRIANPPENARGIQALLGKPAQEHGLANTCLARHKQ